MEVLAALVVIVVVFFALVLLYAALFQWVWNDFIVAHLHMATRASLASCLVVGVLISILVGGSNGSGAKS